MHLVILHYHLNRGGVTQVIRNQLLALDNIATEGQIERVTLLHGPGRKGWPRDIENELSNIDLEIVELPLLVYDRETTVNPRQLAASIQAALAPSAPENTLLHVHNHALGKNAALPLALRLLASEGWPLLLHLHDFVEDFRPANYIHLTTLYGRTDPKELAHHLYPQGMNIHYATLNGRDQNILLSAGVLPERLHWLANPISRFDDLPPKSMARAAYDEYFGVPLNARLALYPVRGIARKNLGELLLWAAVGRGELWTATTLAPMNPKEMRRYQHWTNLADRLNLPTAFECGEGEEGLGFLVNLAAADVILTTSVAEGFGMVFLESWLANRSLAGRDLPEITADFVDAGMQLPGLTKRVNVPVEWVGAEAFTTAFATAFQTVASEYGRQIELSKVQEQATALIQDGNVDFAQLTPQLQSQVIEQVANDDGKAAEVRRLNPTLASSLFGESDDNTQEQALIAHNAGVVAQRFSSEAIGEHLLATYQQVLSQANQPKAATADGLPHGERILQAFLDIQRFQPLRRNHAAE